MQATKVFVIEDPGTMASAVPCYRPRFPPEVRYSILVHNYDNIFSNEHSSPPAWDSMLLVFWQTAESYFINFPKFHLLKTSKL